MTYKKGFSPEMEVQIVINKNNVSFLNVYIELDKTCCRRFDIQSGGVSMYITRLVQERLVPEREEVLPRLIRYRRNKLAHEEGALNEITEIEKSDLKWIQSFSKAVSKHKDPITLYEKKAEIYAKGQKIGKIVKISLALVLAVAAVIALKYFNII